jgi:hypothetical protein
MTITIANKGEFINAFLSPISNISTLALIQITADKFSSLNKSADNNVVLYAEWQHQSGTDKPVELNMPDLKRFIRILESVNDDNVSFILNPNNIEYVSEHTRMKYHLLEPGIIVTPAINLEKINSFEWQTSFQISYETYNTLHKSSLFITDSNKVYLSTKNSKVFAELNDKTRANIDVYSTIIADNFTGEDINSFALSFDIFRMIYVPKNSSISVRVNSDRGVAIFEILDSKYKLQYITTALLK